MADTAFDPAEILRERIVALEAEMADIRAWFTSRNHSYQGLAQPEQADEPKAGD